MYRTGITLKCSCRLGKCSWRDVTFEDQTGPSLGDELCYKPFNELREELLELMNEYLRHQGYLSEATKAACDSGSPSPWTLLHSSNLDHGKGERVLLSSNDK